MSPRSPPNTWGHSRSPLNLIVDHCVGAAYADDFSARKCFRRSIAGGAAGSPALITIETKRRTARNHVEDSVSHIPPALGAGQPAG